MRRSTRLTFGLGVASLLAGLAGCSDGVTDSAPAAERAIVSDPAPDASPVEPDVAFVSLPPNAFASGVSAVITSPRSAGSVTAAVTDGGFDPVPIAARPGDVVEIEIRLVGGGTSRISHKVPVRHPPRVVRTVPPRGKTDVPVNSSFVVVFSEPVAAGTLSSSSVQLLQGATPVPGAVRLVQGTTAAAVFEPAAPLEPNTDYRLVVTEGVRDLQGDVLEGRVTEEFTTGTTAAGPATTVTVLPDTTAVAIGSQVQLIATAHDTNFTLIGGRPITWTTDNSAVATVSATGLVTAVAEGVARVRGELDGRSGHAVIAVSPTLAPVASVEVRPDSATAIVGGLVHLAAVLRDAAGNIVRFRTVAWQSSNPAVAAVTEAAGGTAVVTGVSAGRVTVTATSEGRSATTTITTGTVGPYTQISAGSHHTCAVTGDASAWCWGGYPFGTVGELGNGTRRGTSVPSAVVGGLKFSQVSAGAYATCALTPGGAAYCWGGNYRGGLGSGGSTVDPDVVQLAPVAVSGSRQYSTIGAAGERACALTPSGEAYCWGSNYFGELGLGTTTGPELCGSSRLPCSTIPRAVVGGQTLTALAVGESHTCALTAAGATYCWGRGDAGALGDSTLFDRASPVQVAGGLSFVALTAGSLHTCGLTSDGAAYCWGSNELGELGIGTTTGPQGPCESPIQPARKAASCSAVPVAVSGGLRFSAIGAGGRQTCALTPAGAAYCWGSNGVGDGMIAPGTPTAVAGGLTFASVSVGVSHACGITVTGVTYCWGSNWQGGLGNGSTSNSSVPVKVAGQP